MPTMTDTFSLHLLHFHYSDDEMTEALLESANSVDTDPTVAEVERFYDTLVTHWNRSDVHKPALRKVVGIKVGAGYQGIYRRMGGFLHGGGALPWVNFSRELVALQLIVRIADYKYIDQANHSLCGPVTFMQSVARRDPAKYVDFVIDLATQRRGRDR